MSSRSSDTADRPVCANAAVAFLLMNDGEPLFGEEELVDLVLSVAGAGMSKQALTEFFESRSGPASSDPD